MDNTNKQYDFIKRFTEFPLMGYLAIRFDINLNMTATDSAGRINFVKDDIKYIMYLSVVPNNYILDFSILNEKLLENCTFLVNAFKTTFDTYKQSIDVQDFNEYELILDDNSNLCITNEDEFKVGIIIEKQ